MICEYINKTVILKNKILKKSRFKVHKLISCIRKLDDLSGGFWFLQKSDFSHTYIVPNAYKTFFPSVLQKILKLRLRKVKELVQGQ